MQLATAQRQDRDIAAKSALLEKADADLSEATRDATAEYRAGVSGALRLAQRIERYRDAVVAPAVQRTAAATASYRSNQAPLVTLFEARHAELQAQRKLLALQRALRTEQVQLVYRPLGAGVAP